MYNLGTMEGEEEAEPVPSGSAVYAAPDVNG